MPTDFESDLPSLGSFGDSSFGDKAEALRMKFPNFALVVIGAGGPFLVRVFGFGEL